MAKLIKYKTRLTRNKRIELVKEVTLNRPDETFLIGCPDDAADIARRFLGAHEHTEEHMYMFCLNTKNRVVGIFEISHGNVNSSIIGSREIFQKALLANAVQILLIHNHPSGDPTPSKDDIYVTKKLKELGDFIGVPLVDHLVIGDTHVSLRAEGYFE